MRLFRVLSIFLVLSSLIYGQSNQWVHYFSQSKPLCMAIEGRYLWVGTESFLSRLDTLTKKKEILVSGTIWSVAIDKNGVKWVGTFYGLKKYDGKNWTTYNTSNNSGIPGDIVYSIVFDEQGLMWLATDKGLASFDGQKFTVYKTDLTGNNCFDNLAIDKQGVKWMAFSNTWPNKIFRFDGKNWTSYRTGDIGLGDYYMATSIAVDHQNNKWFASRNGIAEYDGNTWKVYNTSNSALPNNVALKIAVDEQDNKWITMQGALVKLSGQNFTVYNSPDSGLADLNAGAIMVDGQGHKWVGTNTGLSKFDGHYWSQYNTANSELPYFKGVKTIAIDQQGNKWIGLDGGMVVKFNGIDWTQYQVPVPSQIDNFVTSIVIDKQGLKWIGTGEGLVTFDDRFWNVYNTSNSGLLSNEVNSVAIDSQGNKWIGIYRGLTIFDDKNWKNYDTIWYTRDPVPYAPSVYLARDVRAIAIDQQGNKWFGTQDPNLVKFDGQMFFWYNTNSYTVNNVNAIAIDQNGNKWIATEGQGLLKFDGSNWTSYNTSNSRLPGNSISSVVVDKQGVVWAGVLNDYYTGLPSALAKFDGQDWTIFETPYMPWAITIDKYGNKWIAERIEGLSVFREDGVILPDPENRGGETAERFLLYQNYPNPFNPLTNISYSIPENQNVKLTLYDILGKEAATLVNEFKQAGTYTVQFNASHLPSGVYIYTIQAGGYRESKKLMILK